MSFMKLYNKGLAKGIITLILIVAMATLAFSAIGATGADTTIKKIQPCSDVESVCGWNPHPITKEATLVLPASEFVFTGSKSSPTLICAEKCNNRQQLDCGFDFLLACPVGTENVCTRCNPSQEICSDNNGDNIGWVCK